MKLDDAIQKAIRLNRRSPKINYVVVKWSPWTDDNYAVISKNSALLNRFKIQWETKTL